MKEQILHHFREGGKLTHSGVEILPNGKDIDSITIKEIVWSPNEVINGTEKACFVAIFDKNPYTERPMVLNAKNKTKLLKMTNKGEWELETIKNLTVGLTHEPTKMGHGLRIKPATGSAPAEKQKLELTSPNFETLAKWLCEKPERTIAKMKEKYDISKEAEEELNKRKESVQ